MGDCNVLLFDIVHENENGPRECLDEDVHEMGIDAKANLRLLTYSVLLYYLISSYSMIVKFFWY